MRCSALLGFATLLGACIVHTDGGAFLVQNGTLLLDWTINGTKDTNQCIQGAVAVLRIDIYDARGGFVGEYDQDCQVFATTISLAPGRYSGNARLAGASGTPRTTDIQIVPWTIASGVTFSAALDFPASSFMPL
jgi:hypothetical protein